MSPRSSSSSALGKGTGWRSRPCSSAACPRLKRWAHGRLPAAARGSLDTGDLVQEAALHALQRLDVFEPRHVGAMQAYLRMSVINRIRDEVRRVTRRPAAEELPPEHPADSTSPLEAAIQTESARRYRAALELLKHRDREMVVARVEAQWSLSEIAQRFGLRTVDAARMAVSRAIRRLSDHMNAGSPPARRKPSGFRQSRSQFAEGPVKPRPYSCCLTSRSRRRVP